MYISSSMLSLHSAALHTDFLVVQRVAQKEVYNRDARQACSCDELESIQHDVQ